MNPKDIADITKEVIPIKDAYCDALQPGMKQLGKTGETIGMIINTLLLPIRHYVFNWQAKQDQLEKEITHNLEDIPSDRLVEQAPLHVVIPAVQAWSYSIDCDELRKLYANLLANSMLVDKQLLIHPSFVEVIKQLHPMEAMIFKILVTSGNWPVVQIKSRDIPPRKKWFKNIFGTSSKSKGYITEGRHYTIIPLNKKDYIPQPEYLQNLERLGLIEINYGIFLINQRKQYSKIADHEYFGSLKTDLIRRNKKIIFEQGIIEVTPFGQSFSAICVQNPK